MTKKLEEEFNLPPIDEAIKSETPAIEETKNEILGATKVMRKKSLKMPPQTCPF